MLKSDDLINKIKVYNKFLNPETLSKAYNFALKAHADQKRQSGDPYVIHPLAVADILTELKPELRVYNQPVTVTSEADIKTSLYSDKFIVMNLVKDNEFFNVRYQVKPFMIWIWLSTILLAVGGILSLINRKYEK